MSVESFLTRELEIRFIDARMLAAEAKLNLGVCGYPHPEQIEDLTQEAIRIFHERPDQAQDVMRRSKVALDLIRDASIIGSSSSFTGSDYGGSEYSTRRDSFGSASQGLKQKKQRRFRSLGMQLLKR